MDNRRGKTSESFIRIRIRIERINRGRPASAGHHPYVTILPKFGDERGKCHAYLDIYPPRDRDRNRYRYYR